MRRTTTRSPSGRNFIGFLFPKFLELLDYRQAAALTPYECQCRDRYLGRRPERGKARPRKRPVWRDMNGLERPVTFGGFSGYLASARNGLMVLTLFICGSAGISHCANQLRGPEFEQW